MSRFAAAAVLLLGAVAWFHGGYDPEGLLLLELGAAALLVGSLLARDSRGGDPGEVRAKWLAWKRLPFGVRHPELASFIRIFTLGRFPSGRASREVEIFLPGTSVAPAVGIDLAREGFLFGRPVKRTGLLAPLLLLTAWIVLSLVPLRPEALATLSPQAALLRSEIGQLLGENPPASAPWSLAPYPSLRGLWLWLAILALFAAALRAVRSPQGAVSLSLALLILGTASGVLGLAGFLSDLKEAHGRASEALRATGSFGNPNHYAAFQSMLLLSSLGCLAWLRERSPSSPGARGRPRSHESWNERGLSIIAGIGVLTSGLGLLLSLSRSGIAFAVAGIGVFAVLTRGSRASEVGEGGRGASFRALAALLLALAAVAVWIGIEPLLGRFGGLSDQWDKEATRIQVWRDSAKAVGDYWLTGSGLGSFRYVGPRYRTFGGRIFYSWAHNDYLQLGIELGLPGLALVFWLALALVRAGKRARADLAAHPALLALHTGASSAIAAVALHSLTDFSLHLSANLALLALLAAIVVGMERPEVRR